MNVRRLSTQTATPADPAETAFGVLVVEDDDLVRDTVAMQLEGNGWTVTTAENLAAAKAALNADPAISVVVSDIHLASENGFDLASTLDELRPEALATEIIFITGNASSDTAIEALRHRAFDLIRKPLRRAYLAERVDAARTSASRRRLRQAMLDQIDSRLNEGEALRERLIAALRDAEDKNRALEESAGQARHDLLAVIGHELKTPLIPIIGLADIMLNGNELDPEEIREFAGMIRDGGERLGTIIDRTLTYLDAERQHAAMGARDFGVAEMIEAARDHLPDVGPATPNIEISCPHELRASGKPNLLAEALAELIDNAFKASSDGGTVRIVATSTGPERIAVEVIDTGTGLPESVHRNLGVPFLQGDTSVTRRWQGVGLGLARAQKIAQLDGGDVELGVPGTGTGGCQRLILQAAPG